jgi:hypothetical protein
VVAISSKVTATEVGVVHALVEVVEVVEVAGVLVVDPGVPLVSVLGHEVAVGVA